MPKYPRHLFPEGSRQALSRYFSGDLAVFILLGGVLYCCTGMYLRRGGFVSIALESQGSLLIFLVFFVFILAAAILVCLVRPFFSLKRLSPGLELVPDDQPELYEFTQEVTSSIGADQVHRIYINLDVVVDAHYGSFRDYREGKLTLVIGLPLIASISADEYASLLAHECARIVHPRVKFCYFSLYYFYTWCDRIIRNEDGWKSGLDGWSKEVVAFIGVLRLR